MPELPEVETTRRELEPYLLGTTVTSALVRHRGLRWPIPKELESMLIGQSLGSLGRRAKYLLFRFNRGTLIVHLGMSGSLRLVAPDAPFRTHDHVTLLFSNGSCVRYHDPRRFGSMHWIEGDPCEHPLLRRLGPEPLEEYFSGAALYLALKNKRVAIKKGLLDGRVVVGVGNIYASEALFRAGIHPLRAAHRIGKERYQRLAHEIKEVLQEAIGDGGTTLRDYVAGFNKEGAFRSRLLVYERAGEACVVCSNAIRKVVIGGRATYFCSRCQH